jgi:hypothetical protein
MLGTALDKTQVLPYRAVNCWSISDVGEVGRSDDLDKKSACADGLTKTLDKMDSEVSALDFVVRGN